MSYYHTKITGKLKLRLIIDGQNFYDPVRQNDGQRKSVTQPLTRSTHCAEQAEK